MSEEQAMQQAEESAVVVEESAEGATTEEAALAEIADEIGEESVEGEEELAATEEQKQEILKKILKLKVDGEEIEEEIDFNDEESLVRELQKAKAFDKRSQENAEIKKKVGALIEGLKSDPASVLADLGLDVDGFAQSHLEAKIAELEKSPEELEREKMQKELENLKKEKEDVAKKAQEAEFEQLKNHYAQEIESDIYGALEASDTVLTKSPGVIRRVSEAMMFAMNNGYPDVKASDVLPVVEKQFRAELSQLFDALPEDTLEMLIGKNNFDRVRKKRVARMKKAPKKINVAETGQTSEMTKEEQEKQTISDFFSNL